MPADLARLAAVVRSAYGVDGAVAPVPTTDGRPWVEADGSALVLYPYVEGKTAGLNADQWQVFGTIVRRLHDSRPGDGDAARMLEGLFQPGQIVDLARRSR